jgi:aspartate 1-decarboxylase
MQDSGVICLNGAAARLVQPGDNVIIIAYCWVTDEEAKKLKPSIVFVDEKNKIVELADIEIHGDIR